MTSARLCFFALFLLLLRSEGASSFSVDPSMKNPIKKLSSTSLSAVWNRRTFVAGFVSAVPVALMNSRPASGIVDGPSCPSKPCFKGNVTTQWIVRANETDLDMKLLEDFTFVDSKGTEWTAPATYELNGANIPRPLWSFIGSPFYGDYRRASVVHDYYCEDVRKRNYRADDVHRIFYEGMLVDGVWGPKAWLMDFVVRLVNRW